MSSREWFACLCAAGIEAGLLALDSKQLDAVTAVALFVAISLLYLGALWAAAHVRVSILISAAFAFRLTAFFMPPHFSDDLYRYRWEGSAAAAGVNPYDARPGDERLAFLRGDDFAHVDGKDFKAVYGPALQTVQVTLFRLGDGSLSVMKFSACIAEAVVLVLLFFWARGDSRLLAWAWCPLPIVEFWGMGHHDAILIALTLGALYLLERELFARAFVLLGLAAATKYWPILLLPHFVSKRWWLAPVPIIVFALCWWPWHTEISENIRYTSGFVGGWRNNDIFFGALLAAAGSFDRAKIVALALIALASLASYFARGARHALAIVAGTILAVSANVHPWYVCWLLPLAVFRAPYVLAVWAALAPVLYTVLIRWRSEHVWDGVSAMRWIVYVPVGAAIVLQLVQVDKERGVGNPHS
ncbi:MAG: hypothetical protein FJW32_23435 [Acidobacteria bacterium]|nr:hypothetical protein [Acidobacteriota bacterium]